MIDKLNSVILNGVRNLYTYKLLCLTGKGLKPLKKVVSLPDLRITRVRENAHSPLQLRMLEGKIY